jgi:DNA-binding CsgD family transcriptional regulator
MWRVLIASPNATTKQVQQQTRLSEVDVAAAVEQLSTAGMVRTATTPMGVVATDPTLALQSQLARAERDLAERVDAFASIRAQIPGLARDFAQGRADAGDLPGFEIVASVDDIRRQLSLASLSVRADLRSMEHGVPNANLVDGREEQIAVLKRGVRDRMIASTAALAERPMYEAYRDYHQYGHRTRTLANISTRLIVFDRDLAVLPVDPTNMALGAIFIRVQSVIDLINLMYDHMWTLATPLFGEPEVAAAPVGRAARILELLALGNTDERISRTLGVGVRTVRREIADLKTALGVSSRAEVSAAAVRKGWL